MDAELIVVNGPQVGTRHSCLSDEVLIGRAPNANIVLSESDVGWRHCQIQRRGTRFLILDLKTAAGTYINGVRSAERWLEDRDQIGIGKTVLMFRLSQKAESSAATRADTKPVLLAACSLVFLFRALPDNAEDAQFQRLRRQILRLVSDLIPMSEGLLLLGANTSEIVQSARADEAAPQPDFVDFLRRVCEEGASVDDKNLVIGVPLYRAGESGGRAHCADPGRRIRTARDSPGHFDGHRVSRLRRDRGQP